jgi:itaconyl-CoA hydratase
VTVKTRGLNQDDVEVISYERTVLVPKRGHGVEDLEA